MKKINCSRGAYGLGRETNQKKWTGVAVMIARKEPNRVQSNRGPTLDWVVPEEKTSKLKSSIFKWVTKDIVLSLSNSTSVALARPNIPHLPLTMVPPDTSQHSAEGIGFQKTSSVHNCISALFSWETVREFCMHFPWGIVLLLINGKLHLKSW